MNDACICIYDSDSDTLEFYKQKTHIARKEHKCCECHSIINPGTKYESTTGKWDGEVRTYKTCIICVNIRKDLFTCGYAHEMLWENIREHFEGLAYNDDINDDLEWLR